MSTPRDHLFEIPAPGRWRPRTELGARSAALVAGDLPGTLLASDFDGTLAPIVDDPTRARMDDRAREALAGLGPRLGGLAVITGRELDVVRGLAHFEQTPGLEGIVVLGQYGQEEWEARTGRVNIPDAPPGVRAALAELRDLLDAGTGPAEAAGVRLDGVLLEDKGRAIGVHTRRTPDPGAAAAWLREPVREIAERHGLHLEPGRNVVELRGSTITKGDALSALVERTRPRIVVMMGDDLGDLPAFAATRALNAEGITGITVAAASAEQPGVAEQADVLCGGPAGVAAWLQDIVRQAGL